VQGFIQDFFSGGGGGGNVWFEEMFKNCANGQHPPGGVWGQAPPEIFLIFTPWEGVLTPSEGVLGLSKVWHTLFKRF